jgi:hypothetical protein
LDPESQFTAKQFMPLLCWLSQKQQRDVVYFTSKQLVIAAAQFITSENLYALFNQHPLFLLAILDYQPVVEELVRRC